MPITTGSQIAEAALALCRPTPRPPALEILDQVMDGHRGSSPSFDTGLVDHLDPGQPFLALLLEAFPDPHAGAEDAYSQQLLIDRFADRYELWRD